LEPGVVAELHPGKPAQQISGAIAGETAEQHGDHFVHHLQLPIRLWVKYRGELQLHAHESEEFVPKLASEHRVPIQEDGTGDVVQADDVVEEGLHDGGGGVRMLQGYEVAVLGEPVDDRQDDRLAVDAGESHHEVHGNIGPYTRRHVERLEKGG
jgi:hypothetical protein